MPRALTRDDVCEFEVDGRICGGPPFSLSEEHGGLVACRKCYTGWQKTRNVGKVKDLLSGLTAEEKKQLVKELSA